MASRCASGTPVSAPGGAALWELVSALAADLAAGLVCAAACAALAGLASARGAQISAPASTPAGNKLTAILITRAVIVTPTASSLAEGCAESNLRYEVAGPPIATYIAVMLTADELE